MTPEDIEELFSRDGALLDPHDAEEDDDPALTDDETRYRINRLRDVLRKVQTAWDGQSEDLDRIAEKLGDGSRRALWRLPIGESGLLDFFLGILPTPDLRSRLRSHALRLVGNSCADTDENRARVVRGGHIHTIIGLLANDSLLPYVITVLHNVLLDYEPAQLEASEAGLGKRLTDLLSGPRLEACRPLIGLACKILALLITQEPEVRNGSPETPRVLLSVATSEEHPVDLEDFNSLASVALAYLTHETFQTSNLASAQLLLAAFSKSHTAFDPSDAADPDEAAQLKQVRSGFVPVLADISALPGLIPPQEDLLGHPVFQTLQGWLRSPPEHATLQSAACLALGNLARSDATCEALVGGAAIHQPLTSLLARCTGGSSAPNPQLTHAVLGFLKNLAIPAANKPALGRLLDPDLLPRLWSTWGDTQPQPQFVAVSLARLLLVGCPANVARLCAPLSPAPGSPGRDRRTNLHVLLALFDRSDTEPVKTEAARAAANVCRVLHSAPADDPVLSAEWSSPASPPPIPPSNDASARDGAITTTTTTTTTSSGTDEPPTARRRAHLYAAHPTLSAALSFLLAQARFPALRSEAMFVLALASRSGDGARLAQAALEPQGACRALVEAVTGRRGLDDGDDLLLAASAGPQEAADVPDVPGPQQPATVAEVGVGVGVEGLGLGALEPRQVDTAARAGTGRVDRENALCLVAELVRNHAGDLSPARKDIYERLLLTSGELVLNSRAESGRGPV